MEFKTPTREDFEQLKRESQSSLHGEELETMILSIDAVKVIYFGMEDGVLSHVPTRGPNVSTFICNLNSSIIGSIWGAVAGGIAASTGVGLVVGIIAGAAISTISC